MTKPFDYVTSVTFNKKNMMRDTENDELAEKDYNPWLSNMALSNHADTVLYANEMNRLSFLPKRAQYEYFLAAIRKRKRFGYPKSNMADDVELVARVYEVNHTRAKEYLSLLSKQQLNLLRERYSTDENA